MVLDPIGSAGGQGVFRLRTPHRNTISRKMRGKSTSQRGKNSSYVICLTSHRTVRCELPHGEKPETRRGRAGANDPARERKMGCDRGSLPAAIVLALGLMLAGDGVLAQQRYDPGASDTEIKI